MSFKILNFFDVELLTQISAVETELSISPEFLTLFNTASYQYALILTDGLSEPEIVWVTGKNTKLVVLRGQENTVARNWLAGTRIVNALTADSLLQSVDTSGVNIALIAAQAAASSAEASASSSYSYSLQASAFADDSGASSSISLTSRLAAEAAMTAAGVSAAASLTSSQNAAASVTASSASATASQTSRLAAEVAMTNAQTSASASFTSAQAASASATTAGSSATAANTSRLAAEAATTTALGYMNNAELAATGAATSSADAVIARNEAVTARTGALSAESSAISAKDLAVAAQVAATTQAGNSLSSANAAASSATTATSQATLAQSSATASQTSRLAAEAAQTAAGGSASGAATSAANAVIARDDAVSARTDAQTAAANASTSASLAATSATNAGNSATAAATSASSASTSATSAGSSATSATNSANTAATQAGNASSSASAAATSASSASTSSTNAGSSASSATNSANTASTQAGNAAVSASSAASSAALADSLTGALAIRQTALEARSYAKGNLVRGSRPNFDSANPNNLFARFGWQNQGLWNVNYSNFVDGPFLSQALTSQTGYNWFALNSNAVPVSPGVAMSAQAMLAKFGTWNAGTIGIVIYWYSDLAGTTLVSGTPNGVIQNWEDGLVVQGQNSQARWVRTPNQIAPAGAQSCRMGVYTANATGNGVYTEAGAWMLKLEYGGTCTAWTDEAMPLEIDARVRTEESARASADSALASRATTLEATVNDGTTGLVATRARLITEESVRASADGALAARATTLEAQMANSAGSGLQSRISIEESARASADSAQASQITTLLARSYVKGNLVKGSRPNFDPPSPNGLFSRFGWLFQGLWNVANSVYVDGPYLSQSLTSQTNYNWVGLSTNAMPIAAGLPVSVQVMLGKFGTWTTGTLQLQIYWYSDAAGTTLHSGGPSKNWESGTVIAGQNGAARWVDIANAVAPSGVQSFRLGINTINATGNGSYTEGGAWMLKAEYGSTCTAWTDEALASENDARVTINSGAIATLNSSAAFWQVLVAASGGDPAIVRLFSGLGGSEISLAAKVLSLINTSSGVAMPVMRATGGEAFFQRPISSDFGSRRVTIGPGYGVSGSEVVLWFGPSTIAPASQSRTNCIFALGTDGIVYYGGLGLQVGGMQGTLNLYDVNLTRSGAGATVQSMTATGFAPGTITYLWELISGDAVNIGSSTSATTNIGHSLGIGETKTSVVRCTMTSSAGPVTFRLLSISSSEIS